MVKDAQGRLETQYFLRLLQFVGINTRTKLKDQREESQKKRREAYTEGPATEQYKGIVKDLI